MVAVGFESAANFARDKFVSGVQEVSKVCNQVVTNSGAFQKVLKIALRIIDLAGYITGRNSIPLLGRYLNNSIEIIDAAQIFPDGYDLLTTPFERKNALDIAATATFFTADVGGLVLLADDLAKTAASIGSTPFLSEAARGLLGAALNGVVGVGYGIMLAKAGYDLSVADSSPKVARSILQIVRCIIEIAAKVFALFGVQLLIAAGLAAAAPTAIIVVPIALGLLGAGFGITVFVMDLYINGKV